MRSLARPSVAGLLLALASCGGDDAVAPSAAAFVFAVRGLSDSEGRFVAVTSDPVVLARLDAQLALPESERGLHISGPVAPGDGGHNAPWGWHFVPSRWDVVEASIEVCDGVPGDVEKDVAGWVSTVGTFCPWASYVQRRL